MMGIARRWLMSAALLALVLGLALALVGAVSPGAVGSTVDAGEQDGGPTRVMFVGDSLTGSPGCWRAPVWVALTDQGFDIDMVGIRTENECGDVVNAAGAPWDPDNTGIGGVTSTRMWVKIARDKVLDQTTPDVIVMLLGTNDLLGGATVADITTQYDALVTLFREKNPDVSVVVAAPPPIAAQVCDCEAERTALIASLPAWAEGVTTTESPVTIAVVGEDFDPDVDTVDGIHQNAAGDAKLAAAIATPVAAALTAHAEAAQSDSVVSVWMWVALALVLALALLAWLGIRSRRTNVTNS